MTPLKKHLTVAGAALAASAVALTTLAPAGAMSRDDLTSRLQKQGYTVQVQASAVDHPTLDIDGRVLTVSKGGKSATVEILDYGTGQKLRLDWTVENGKGPVPKDATNDFTGRIPMWNNDSVILADFRTPNDQAVAKAIADTYLERAGAPTTPTAPTNPSAPKPPATGNGVMPSDDGGSAVSPQLVAMAAVTAVSVGGIALTRRQQRRNEE